MFGPIIPDRDIDIKALRVRMADLETFDLAFSRLRRDLEPSSLSTMELLDRLVRDTQDLLKMHHRAWQLHKGFADMRNKEFQGSVLEEQLKESQQSRQQALSVNRLTRLAFVYIPINFVCTMLGMNLSVFGQGNVPLWGFFLLALVMTSLTLLPIAGTICTTIEQKFLPPARISCHLFVRSPLVALDFFLYYMIRDSQKAERLVLHYRLDPNMHQGWRSDDEVWEGKTKLIDDATCERFAGICFKGLDRVGRFAQANEKYCPYLPERLYRALRSSMRGSNSNPNIGEPCNQETHISSRHSPTSGAGSPVTGDLQADSLKVNISKLSNVQDRLRRDAEKRLAGATDPNMIKVRS